MNLENFRNRLSIINERFIDQNNHHQKINDDMLQSLENVKVKEDSKTSSDSNGLIKDIDTLISSIEKQLDFQSFNLDKTQELVRYPQDTCIQR